VFDLKKYLYYKLLNSAFGGLSIGSVFIIYESLKPSVYSIGGIVLALGMLVVARFYDKILDARSFFIINLFVEFVLLFLIIFFLLTDYGSFQAFVIYSLYQLTFIFGSYLPRAETLIFENKESLKKIDTAKQSGYLGGMLIVSVFYYLLESWIGVVDKKAQIEYLHILLLVVQLGNIYIFVNAYKKEGD